MYTYTFVCHVTNITNLDFKLKSKCSYIQSVTYHSDHNNLDVISNEPLSNEHIELLENEILNFDDIATAHNHKYLPQVISPITIASESYETLSSWTYNGVLIENTFCELGFHTHMKEIFENESSNNSNFTYSIRIFDSDNSISIGESTFSNVQPEYYEIDFDMKLMPEMKATLQLQAKKDTSAGSNVTLSSLQFIYNS